MSVQQHHVPHPTEGSGSIPERLTIVLEPLHGGILKSIVNTLGTMGSGTWRFVAMTTREGGWKGRPSSHPAASGGSDTPSAMGPRYAGRTGRPAARTGTGWMAKSRTG